MDTVHAHGTTIPVYKSVYINCIQEMCSNHWNLEHSRTMCTYNTLLKKPEICQYRDLYYFWLPKYSKGVSKMIDHLRIADMTQ